MTRPAILMRHPTILIMAAICGLSWIGLLAFAPLWILIFVPFGIVAQMFNEYNLHRFVFHMRPPRRQWAFNLLYRAHYGHHDFPTNVALFFVPLWVALPMLAVNFAALYGILTIFGVAQAGWIAVAVVPAGAVMTFLGYEWFHMTAHLTVRKTALERRVTRLHNQHHFRDFSRWFHVTPGGEIIDRMMGTAIDADALKRTQRIEFMRTLGLRPDDPRLVTARRQLSQKYGLSAADVARAAGTPQNS